MTKDGDVGDIVAPASNPATKPKSPSVSETTTQMKRAAIVGVGLLGTSVALGLKRQWPGIQIIGTARREVTRRAALDLGAIDDATDDLLTAARDADLIVICTPVDLVAEQVCQAARVCAAQALITDVGSTKAEIVATVEKDEPASAYFVGSHPLAGSEKTGPWHGRAELFRNRLVITTPTEKTNPARLDRCERVWQGLGARVLRMSPEEHDMALAATSHVPHVVAAALAAVTKVDLLKLAGTGWRDTTRVAGGDPGLWRAILAANSHNVVQQLDEVILELQKYRAALSTHNFVDVHEHLAKGKTVHDAYRTPIE
jgi:prephenate dehydrogenase